MTLTHDYAEATRRAESVFSGALDTWRTGVNAFNAPMQAMPSTYAFPQFDAAEAVELQFKFINRVVNVNHEYAVQLAEAANTVAGAFRQHLEGLNTAVLEQFQGVSEATQTVIAELEDSVRETADEVERVQREAQEGADQAAREARQEAEKAEREQRRQARSAAREHFRSLTKNELSAEAAKRNLTKTGTVDELVDRLVEADTKK
jgi:ABC-type transporter Mla subunit MlaD